MTSGLASDSDKFKIIITLRRAQRFWDTGPYKKFIFLFNPLTVEFFFKFELNAMGHICPISLCRLLSSIVVYCCCLLSSVVGAIGRAGLRKEVELLRPGPRGSKVLRHQMVQWCAGGTEYPRWWHRQWGRQQFCWFFKLDKYAMTSGLASDSDKFKIIITLRRVQRFWDTGPYKKFIFLFNPLTVEFFLKFELNAMGHICPISLRGLISVISISGMLHWLWVMIQ